MVCKRWLHRARVLVLLSCIVPASSGRAQGHGPVSGVRLGATAVGLWTLADPAFAGESRSEAYLTQPMLFGHASLAGGRLAALATINFEGWTLRRGELAAGNAGEGYIDRRHPHTFVHEAMIMVQPVTFGGLETSLAAGRGFAPFGTDDPMVRPFTKYPSNHHLAQVLERLILVGAVRHGPVMLEAAVFNGEEPIDPEDLGRFGRFGDSWSVRVTGLPMPWLELQTSHAYVKSPEHVFGGGLDHRKWSTSARFESAVTDALDLYGLLEWARTDKLSVGQKVFTFESGLGEVAVRKSGWQAALRFERTTRPEEERLSDPFRSARPHSDENIIAITRWTSVTGRVDRTFGTGRTIEPFVEVSRHAVERTIGVFFDPITQFGDDRLWTISFGARIGAGAQHSRMGRYGVAVPAAGMPPVEADAAAATHGGGTKHDED